MRKILTCIFVLFFQMPILNLYAQQKDFFGEKYVYKKHLQVNNQMVYSLCDSLINHSKKCLPSPVWYKLKFYNSDEDPTILKIWCVSVQFLDSSYYCNNKEWIIGSEFSISQSSVGVFSYMGLRFEVMAPPSLPIERYLTISDSLVQVCLWDSSAKPIMMPIRGIFFPEYFQMLWTINLPNNEIRISQEICSCNKNKARKKKCKLITNEHL